MCRDVFVFLWFKFLCVRVLVFARVWEEKNSLLVSSLADLEDGVVVNVQKENGEIVSEEVDFAILAIGVRPESQLAQAAGVSFWTLYSS